METDTYIIRPQVSFACAELEKPRSYLFDAIEGNIQAPVRRARNCRESAMQMRDTRGPGNEAFTLWLRGSPLVACYDAPFNRTATLVSFEG